VTYAIEWNVTNPTAAQPSPGVNISGTIIAGNISGTIIAGSGLKMGVSRLRACSVFSVRY